MTDFTGARYGRGDKFYINGSLKASRHYTISSRDWYFKSGQKQRDLAGLKVANYSMDKYVYLCSNPTPEVE